MFDFFHRLFFRHKPRWKEVSVESFLSSSDMTIERCEVCGRDRVKKLRDFVQM